MVKKKRKRDNKSHIKGQGTLLQMKGIKRMVDIMLDREKQYKRSKRQKKVL